MDIVSVTLMISFAFILFWQMSIAPKGSFLENGFSREVSKGIQGYFALLAIVHHVYVFLHARGIEVRELKIFQGIGVYVIGFFFFCSGYGLITSLKTKESYLKGFLKKRVLIVLVPFFICNYLYLFAELLAGARFPIHELLATFFGVLLLNTQMWFAVEIMLLYLAFYVIFTYAKKEQVGIVYMALVIAGLTVIGMLHYVPGEAFNWFWGEWWYNTTPLLIIGMLVACYREQIEMFAKKHYSGMLIGTGLLTMILIMISKQILEMYGYWTGSLMDRLFTYSVQMPSVIAFVLLLWLILQKVRVTNDLLEFLGKFSLEIILVNGVFLELFLQTAIRYGIFCYLCITFVCTFVAAVLLYRLKRFILEIR